ncbi:hypothetical protein CF319_g8439 [Tilletia indica]|uniref:Uncharacterized protein n=1 Tax=Tilletia indica TaxID=43049 RepID=A0A177T3U4_9BASI|nr:hypothetical protein CF319_g8439 [Tilletia indica]KAE8221194.1 hypothetical protein CF326_g8607 [Tilletia indica]KAE8244559.1 hypothetical protein A4X13_0g6493 [Tilletia indica]
MTVLVFVGGYTLFADMQLQLRHEAEFARQTNELCGFANINVQPPTYRFLVFISMVGRAAIQIRISFGLNSTFSLPSPSIADLLGS